MSSSTTRPARPPRQGCYNCMKRRIVCDQTKPHCDKCHKKGLVCPGYGIRYRFASRNNGPNGLGESGGTRGPSATADEVSPAAREAGPSRELQWVNGPGRPRRRRKQQALPGPGKPDAENSKTEDPGTEGEDAENQDEPVMSLANASSTLAGLMQQQRDGLGSIRLPPILADEDRQVRLLFDHSMLMIDDEANGYRYQILPRALENPILKRAVCVVAAFHLANRQGMRELRARAEEGRGAIIRKLREEALATRDIRPHLDEVTWTVVLLLVVGDLVTGHEHVLVLYRMLASFFEASIQGGTHSDGARSPAYASSSPLRQFLFYQSSLITFFARPMLAEATGVQGFQQVARAPLTSFEQYAPRRQQTICLPPIRPTEELLAGQYVLNTFETIWQCTTDIYLLRAGVGPDASFLDPEALGGTLDANSMSALTEIAAADVEARIAARTADLRALIESVRPKSIAAHTTVWPAFVGGAEARTEDDKQFFVGVLQRIYNETGYGNVTRAIEALPRIWNMRQEERWTASLPALGTVIM